MSKYYKNNLKLWNKLTEIHKQSDFYDLKKFIEGKSSLKSIEKEELGDVSGKSLLHLQCHFGMDSLSWQRMGAEVTGVDFSDNSIELARKLNKELGLKAKFICSNIYNLKEQLTKKFDIVFTSYGVLTWLDNLKKWGEIISYFLKPGGTFYIIEFHPCTNIFENEDYTTELKVTYPYFFKSIPMKFAADGSYADREAPVTLPSYEWPYSVGDILNSLINGGLTIKFFHEFPFCAYKKFPFMEKEEDGWWRFKNKNYELPLMFSLKAVKSTYLLRPE